MAESNQSGRALGVAALIVLLSVPGLFHFLAMLPGRPIVEGWRQFPGQLFGLLSPIGVFIAVVLAIRSRRSAPAAVNLLVGLILVLAAIRTWSYLRVLLDLVKLWT